MSCGTYSGRPEGQSIPYFVNGQYYYDYKQDYYRDATDPKLVEFSEDFRELYIRGHELFHKILPNSCDDFRTTLEGVLDRGRLKTRTRAGTMQRSLSVSSPRVRCRGLGGNREDVLRLERFNVKTVDLEDDEVGAGDNGGQGGQGGPGVTTTSANSKR